MDMAAVAGFGGEWFGHERDADAESVGQFLHGVFHERMPVGHGQRIGVANVELVLASPGFALGVLDRNPGLTECPAGRPYVSLHP